MTATVRSLVLRRDPCSAQPSERVERVSERIRSVRARTRVLSGRISELAGQFLDGELVEQAGPTRGQALAREGRIAWLAKLAKLHRSYCVACEEESQLQALLRRMEQSPEADPPSAL